MPLAVNLVLEGVCVCVGWGVVHGSNRSIAQWRKGQPGKFLFPKVQEEYSVVFQLKVQSRLDVDT